MFNEAFAGTLPIRGTEIAGQWDDLYNFILWLSVFFFILVVGAMIHFAYKYRNRPNIKTRYITGHHLLEGIWIVVPTILLLVIFGWGYKVYNDMTRAPSDAYEVRVIGKQWLWQFQYDHGATTVGELFVPVNKPVKLIMTSEDVLHSFFIPNFRVKQDVVPGMYTSVWFETTVTGEHQIYCTEYCGTSHSGMLGKVIALEEEQWKAWVAGKKLAKNDAGDYQEMTKEAGITLTSAAPVSLAQQGKGYFESRGCVSCHTPDGTSKVGPTLKGAFGKKVELADGTSVIMDEAYFRESLEMPQAKLVKGYTPSMPTFKGVLKETEVNAILAYVKSLK